MSVGCEDAVGSIMSEVFWFSAPGEVVMPTERDYDPKSHLCFADIQVDNLAAPSLIHVKIKTDPFRERVTLFIGATGCSLCPVRALLNYMVVRGGSPGPLFR